MRDRWFAAADSAGSLQLNPESASASPWSRSAPADVQGITDDGSCQPTEEAVMLILPGETAVKRRVPWGYLPLASEILPPSTGGRVAGIAAGLLCGLRVCLTTAGYGSVIFAMSDNKVLAAMYPQGVHLLWISACVGILWNGVFGRLQYSIADIQGAVAMQLSDIVGSTVHGVEDGRVAATVLVVLTITAFAIGLTFLLAGSLRFGRIVMQFPISATCGFLVSVGWSVVRAGLMMATQTDFSMFYPSDWGTGEHGFTRTDSLMQLSFSVLAVLCMRLLPVLLHKLVPAGKTDVAMLYPALASLLPLGLFYLAVGSGLGGVGLEDLRERGWLFEKPAGDILLSSVKDRSFESADWSALLQWGVIYRVIILCVMVLVSSPIALVGIADAFASAPHLPGDPAPLEPADPDVEMRNLGVSAMLNSLIGGVPTYHSLGNSVATRLEGGTHRISSFSAALFLCLLYSYSVPIQSYVPKFFLAGVLLNIGCIFLKQSLFDTRHLLPRKEYAIVCACLVVQLLSAQLVDSLSCGFLLAVVLFVCQASRSTPLAGAVYGADVRSTVRRPEWEVSHLEHTGRRTLVLRLSGLLFFGSVSGLSSSIMKLLETFEGQSVCFIVLDFADVAYVDASAARGCCAIRQRVEAAGKRLLYSCLSDTIAELVLTAEAAAPDDIFAVCDDALEACEEHLLADTGCKDEMACRWALHSASPPEAAFARLLGLAPELVPTLQSCATVLTLPAGASVALHGDRSRSLFIVRSGVVDVMSQLVSDAHELPRRGRRKRRQRVRCGGFLCHDTFLADMPQQGDVGVAEGAGAELWSVSRESWDSMPRQVPALHAALLRLLLVDVARQSAAHAYSVCGHAGAEFTDRAYTSDRL